MTYEKQQNKPLENQEGLLLVSFAVCTGRSNRTKERHGSVADFSCYKTRIPDMQDYYILQKI